MALFQDNLQRTGTSWPPQGKGTCPRVYRYELARGTSAPGTSSGPPTAYELHWVVGLLERLYQMGVVVVTLCIFLCL